MALYRVWSQEYTTLTLPSPPSPPPPAITAVQAGQMRGTRRCREILSSLPRDSQVHLVHVFQTALSTPVPGREMYCFQWSCSVAQLTQRVILDISVFVRCVFAVSSFIILFFFFFWPIVTFALLRFFHSFLTIHTHTR